MTDRPTNRQLSLMRLATEAEELAARANSLRLEIVEARSHAARPTRSEYYTMPLAESVHIYWNHTGSARKLEFVHDLLTEVQDWAMKAARTDP